MAIADQPHHRQIKHIEIEQLRHTPNASILLFITDRCPVGCAHCSVDSRENSPTISDFDLFNTLLMGVVNNIDLQIVGISGGEPFIEKKGLIHACDQLSAHGKRIVVYTSGVWAKSPHIPVWIKNTLKSIHTVYLSTDSYHQRNVPTDAFIRAAQTIANSGAWIVVQTLEPNQATQLLVDAFGEHFSDWAEVVPLKGLEHGRGGNVFSIKTTHAGQHFGACSLAITPVMRYDGQTSACCNESIIQGKGPTRLRKSANSMRSLQDALSTFRNDPLLKIISGIGIGALTEHPRLKHLAEQRFTDPCGLCWKVMEHYTDRSLNDPLINAIAALDHNP